MGHILIQNKGELPIWGIRLMGLSDKTPDKIGRFGTGLKESIALLARLGLQPIIFSGELRMDFMVQFMDGQEEICFKLSEARGRFAPDTWHGLGIHPNLGRHDWDDPWMIFREIMCNALDESGTDDLFHDIVYHEPEGKAGSTRFYIPTNKAIMEAYSCVTDKLLPLGTFEVEIEVTGAGRAIKNRKHKKLQMFHHGVWIQEGEKESLFDYDIEVKLNESRSADWYDINVQLAKIVAHYTQPQALLLLKTIVKDSNDDVYEAIVLQQASYYIELDAQAWTNAFHALWGENAVLTDNSQYLYEKLRSVDKEPVVITHSGLTALLTAAGVPTVDRVLTREQRAWESITEPTVATIARFDLVWDILGQAGLRYGAKKPRLRIFAEAPGRKEIVFGSYNHDDNIVYLNATIVGSAKERQACVEELAHCISEASDETRQFQTFLLELLDHFMFVGIGAERPEKILF